MRDKHAEISRAIALVRMDAKGQGVPCGSGWIPRSKKCSKDKARSTSVEAKKRGAEKAREYNQLRSEVKASTGMKSVAKPKPFTVKKLSENEISSLSRSRKEYETRKSLRQIKEARQQLETVAHSSVGTWGDVVYFFKGKTSTDDKIFDAAQKALEIAQRNHFLLTSDFQEKVPSRTEIVKAAQKRRQAKLSRKAAIQRKVAEQKAWKAAKRVTQERLKQLPVIERSLFEIPDQSIATNLRRRLEERIKTGSINTTELDRAFNAVSGSKKYKDDTVAALKKSGIKVLSADESLAMFEKSAPYSELASLSTSDRSKRINETASALGISEDDAYEMYKQMRDANAVERRRKKYRNP